MAQGPLLFFRKLHSVEEDHCDDDHVQKELTGREPHIT